MQEFKVYPKIIIAAAPQVNEFELQRKILTSCLTITNLPSHSYSIEKPKIIVPLSSLTELNKSEAQDSNPASPSIQSPFKNRKANSQIHPFNSPSITSKPNSTAKSLSQVYIPRLDLDKITKQEAQVPDEAGKSSNDELQKIIKQFKKYDLDASSSSDSETNPRNLIKNIQEKWGLKLESEENSLKSDRFLKEYNLNGVLSETKRGGEESQHWDFEESTARVRQKDDESEKLVDNGHGEMKGYGSNGVKVKQVEIFKVRERNKLQVGIGFEGKKKGNENKNKKIFRGNKVKDLVILDKKSLIDSKRAVHESNKTSLPEKFSQEKTPSTSIIYQKHLNPISTPSKPMPSIFNSIKPTQKPKILKAKQGFPSYKDYGFITDLHSQRPWLKSSKILHILSTLTKSAKNLQSRRQSLPKLSSNQFKILDSQYNKFFK